MSRFMAVRWTFPRFSWDSDRINSERYPSDAVGIVPRISESLPASNLKNLRGERGRGGGRGEERMRPFDTWVARPLPGGIGNIIVMESSGGIKSGII